MTMCSFLEQFTIIYNSVLVNRMLPVLSLSSAEYDFMLIICLYLSGASNSNRETLAYEQIDYSGSEAGRIVPPRLESNSSTLSSSGEIITNLINKYLTSLTFGMRALVIGSEVPRPVPRK